MVAIGTTRHRAGVTTLHIEHAITDYPTWRAAFDAFAEARRSFGVTAERVAQPRGEPEAIVVDLEFASTAEAAAFLEFLEHEVWSSPSAAPALVGRPRTTLLEPRDATVANPPSPT